jgi:hypothetical protein
VDSCAALSAAASSKSASKQAEIRRLALARGDVEAAAVAAQAGELRQLAAAIAVDEEEQFGDRPRVALRGSDRAV